MNLDQLRKLVEETKDLPGDTVIVTSAELGTFEQVNVRKRQILVFKKDRSQCPLGSNMHRINAPAMFRFKGGEAELSAHADLKIVLEVY